MPDCILSLGFFLCKTALNGETTISVKYFLFCEIQSKNRYMATHLTSKVGYRIEAPSYNLYPSRLWFCDENIIYVISCEKSNGDCIKVHPQYVGETGNSAKRRCAGHISSIVIDYIDGKLDFSLLINISAGFEP